MEQARPRRLPFNTLLVLLLKSTKLLKVAKVFKALKLVKVAGMFLSMAISVFAYSFLMGPWFAVGFVLLLFMHEMGHVAAMWARGYPARAPVFIPMLGAVIFAPPFKSRDDEAFIGYGGPLAGSLAAALCILWWQFWPSEMALRLAYTSAFLNLFNLLPIRPLDGGRVLQVVGSWVKYIAVALLLLLSWAMREPSLLLIWILILDDIGMRPRLKAYAGWTFWLAMTGMMVAGMSQQPLWVCTMDIMVGGLFVNGYTRRARAQGQETEQEEIHPDLPMPARLGWASAFIVLVGLLVVMMAGNTPVTTRPAVAIAVGLAAWLAAAGAMLDSFTQPRRS